MSSCTSISAKRVFTGHDWFYDHTIKLENGVVKSIIPSTQPAEIDIVAPSFIDLQLYGAGGYLFSEYPSTNTLDIIYQHCLASGTAYFMPTLATNSNAIFKAGIQTVQSYWKGGGKGCLGLHLEGPWINPEKRGAHDPAFIHSPEWNEVTELLAFVPGVVKMITLAPEICSQKVIQFLYQQGVVISAGHSLATYEQAMNGFSQGIKCVTHLFNAMSPLQHRAPGLVGATLHHKQVMASIIPDGYHVDWSVISIAHQVMGDRLFVITDAVTNADSGPYQHELRNDHYVANGVLSGSALNMLQAFNNLISKASLSLEAAIHLCTINPARAIGMEKEIGYIEVGKPFQGILLNATKESFYLTQLR
jgi:N-acetylglucosamine-6-phosphate deacetylase